MDLNVFFKKYKKAAIAFSGGVDSAYLLYAAVKAGVDVTAYYVKSDFQPQFELDDALKLSEMLGAKMRVIYLSVLDSEQICSNPENRCYFCKQKIFGQILSKAKSDGYDILLDGTNASDDDGDRPGVKAKNEMGVLSPLRECGLTKEKIRALSKEAGLFTWDKPSYACLATRIPSGVFITKGKLEATEKSEDFMRNLGFKDFRVRMRGENALIQLIKPDFEKYYDNQEIIRKELSKYYKNVTLDETPREIVD